MLAGCQSDSETVSSEEFSSMKVLTFEMERDIAAERLTDKVESIQGFLFLNVFEGKKVALHFSSIASDEYLKKRTKKVLSEFSGRLVSLSYQKLPAKQLIGSQVSDEAGVSVRRAIEKPEAPMQQFPNVFDLFRFLF